MAQSIRQLELGGSYWTNLYVSFVIPQLHQLTFLHLGKHTTGLSSTCLKYLPLHCRQLESLILDGTRLSRSVFINLDQHCHQLRHLDLRRCVNLPPKFLNLMTSCPLEELHLNTNNLSNERDDDDDDDDDEVGLDFDDDAVEEDFDDDDDGISNEFSLVASIKKCHGLTSLWVIGLCYKVVKSLLLSKATTTPLWPDLTLLALDNCKDMDDTTMIEFMELHPQITTIKLWEVQKLTDTTLDVMMKALPQLTQLTLDGSPHFSSAAVRELVWNCPSLELVELYDCKRISSANFLGSVYDEDQELITLNQEAIDRIQRQVQQLRQ